ncbi:cell division protein FtsQ/DivIB [Psychroserpens sp. XS_ASV72]|uniref:cell division protein FtsQ/DivIB n=1 Tax=Psychroserpens sp. XS_ASV72 TaxID=3241293 RepID=UPI003517564B
MCLLALVVFLFVFSSYRNATRKVSTPLIQFVGDENLFITQETVSKLLIQNQDSVTNKPKDIIDLNALEAALNTNPMIKQAQVFMSVDGLITAKVEQKKPIARVSTNASYYIDEQGGFMPLSTNYSARVPLVTGAIEKNNLSNVFAMAQKVKADEFLRKHVVEIHQNEDESIDLWLREYDFKIHLGQLKMLDKKINNLKAFYLKAMKDKTLDSYSVVNLKFDKQVICTKK